MIRLKNWHSYRAHVLVTAVILLLAVLAQSQFVLANRTPIAEPPQTDVTAGWEKIEQPLKEAMEQAGPDELIHIYVFLYNQPVRQMVREKMLEETGMDPAIYEDDQAFEEQIVPRVTQEVIAQYGDETTDELIDQAIREEAIAYDRARRGLSIKLFEQDTQEFMASVRDYSPVEPDSIGNLSGSAIWKVPNKNILKLAQNSKVEGICLFENVELMDQ